MHRPLVAALRPTVSCRTDVTAMNKLVFPKTELKLALADIR
jgi:hypothetical protein